MNFYTFDLDPQQETFVKAILSADNTVVFCNATAGTGKTNLAMRADHQPPWLAQFLC